MKIESITLKLGELALPSYTLFKGSLNDSVYFRFTIPESQLANYKEGKEITIYIPYQNRDIKGKIRNIKQIGAYANITTAYPDYEIQDALYELLIDPVNIQQSNDVLSKTTVTLKP
ncbi:hypothetical protein [Chryseobacterium gleum]|uniref:hypothetical protein n=1 Tax=Chryseobacterium gleum TaxID=250 RepID=UPI00241EC405|nr:hypothetical protein [Chryseobacterium gleum]